MPALKKIGAAALSAFGFTSGTSGLSSQVLVIAGGGAGGAAAGVVTAGGGGAGGVCYHSGKSLDVNTTYTVVIGAGAAGGATGATQGPSGSNSSFDTITALGGGGGGAGWTTTQSIADGAAGGSGGGGGSTQAGASGAGGASTQGSSGGATGYGFAGGYGLHTPGVNAAGGGGGGAGAAGANVTSSNWYGGVGGVGLSTWSSWGAATSTGQNVGGTYYYAGGGGGGSGIFGNNSAGGYGGGAYGGYGGDATQAPNAQANTGGGGGGGPVYTGAGGSGLVIVRYQGTQQFVGGVVTTDGTYIYHTFTTSGSLVPITTPITANFLVVAGGGGGGTYASAGGGGAGGFRTSAGTSGGGGSAESALSLSLSTSYTVIVGAGGIGKTGGSGAGGTNGSNSSISGTGLTTVTSVGGGVGASANPTNPAGNGGSGGGGAANGQAYGTGTANQGYDGGTAAYSTGNYPGGGGGGAGQAGQAAPSSSVAGYGGNGVSSTISGTATFYAGGGGGSVQQAGGTAGVGGSGGGGAGGNQVFGTAGTANTGGGAGASAGVSANGPNGGSGIVIISYAGSQLFGGGVVTTAAGNTIHTFYTSGTLSPISTLLAQYLIVAGGGGGAGDLAGGGGGGGFLTGANVTIDTNSTYVVTVGAGGAGGTATRPPTGYTAGGNSSFSLVSTVAVGGGASIGYRSATSTTGGSGGSGAGGSAVDSSSYRGSPGPAVIGQGYPGGTGGYNPYYFGGGGGGASQAGTNAAGVAVPGSGGNGTSSSISGTATYYAGGGGGGGYSAQATVGASGGLGGGGTGGGSNNSYAGQAGSANTGGGGGGGGYILASGPGAGGSGGSGVVIIAYPGSTQRMAGGAVTVVNNTTVHTFTTSGYLSPLTYFGNSLRWRSSASAYLSRTPTVASNRTTWTWSAWVKKGTTSGYQNLFSAGTAAGSNSGVSFHTDSNSYSIDFYAYNGGYTARLLSSQLMRDYAAWYHIVAVYDSTQATASNRMKLYLNGVQMTAFNTATYPSQNVTTDIDNTTGHYLGNIQNTNYFDGYMTNINFIDGQALAPTAFGAFNNYGVWQPVTYGGSYGTNGFFLPFNAGAQSYAASFSGSSQYLSIAQNTALNLAGGDWTIECWFNWNGSTADYRTLFAKRAAGAATPASYQVFLYTGTGVLYFYNGTTSTSTGVVPTANKWNHLACVQNGSNVIIYLNGVSIATIANTTTDVNTPFYIGYSGTAAEAFTGYISNFRIVKGTAVYTTNFTPSTTPLTAISGTSLLTLQNSTIVDNSTNALTITNTGSVTTAPDLPLSTGIFNDQSPQGNNWTPNNISGIPGVTLDYMTDVPTLSNATSANYCVLNILQNGMSANGTISDGNLKFSCTGLDNRIGGSLAVSTGKWYYEVTLTAAGTGTWTIGISKATSERASNYQNLYWNGYFWEGDGYKQTIVNGVDSGTPGSAPTYTTGDVIGFAFDLDAGTITAYKNNVSTVTWTGVTTGVSYIPSFYVNNGAAMACNFGQQPWAYGPPTGYVALNAYNM